MSNTIIYDMANRIAEKYNTRNPFEIADYLGIEVVFYDLGSLKGFYNIVLKNKFVALNENLSENMQKVVLAHEIGHDKLHCDLVKNGAIKEFSLYDMTAKPEREANVFASNLIISDEEVLGEIKITETSFNLAKILNVPHELVLIKLKDMQNRGYKLNCLDCRGDFLRF